VGDPGNYGPDGTMALALTPASAPPATSAFSLVGAASAASSDPSKKSRGRPPGSGKKQQMTALGKSKSNLSLLFGDSGSLVLYISVVFCGITCLVSLVEAFG